MQRDILCHLIQFQYNISQLNDEEFITFCAELMRKLSRKEIESILFSGLNSMRLRGCRSSLRVKSIISRGSNITFNIKIKSKMDQNEWASQTMTLATINTMVQFQHLPQYLCNYLCDFLDIQSLLTLQLINRYFCVISRRHRNYSLLLIISPYNSLPTNRDYTYNTFLLPSINENEPLQHEHEHESIRSQARTTNNNTNNDNFLHSVNETALNSGYYKKFFIPIKKLGAGSYGSVFLVNHIMHGIYLGKFAMKIVCVGDDSTRLIDILREVRTLQQLHHRNVIDYKHSWLENYQPAITGPSVPCLFILMEYADMGSILDYVIMEDRRTHKIKRKWLTEHEIWTIMFETCMGLKHLHQYGIVHRDIKPGNLLMTSLHKRHMIEYEDLELYDTNYRIVISDLGQADFVNHKESQPKTGNTGAFGFASPELVLGSDFMCNDDMNDMNDDNMESNDSWDESVDIWSLGHLLYFLTFSRMPYEQCLNDNNGDDQDENLPDLHEFYQDIISGTNKLWYPSNNGRSQVMINMIKKLCQIEPKQRPSLDSIILAIANILRSHQYISISYSNNDPNRFRALIAPSRNLDNDSNHNHNNMYPVIKYIPQYKTLQALLPKDYQNL